MTTCPDCGPLCLCAGGARADLAKLGVVVPEPEDDLSDLEGGENDESHVIAQLQETIANLQRDEAYQRDRAFELQVKLRRDWWEPREIDWTEFAERFDRLADIFSEEVVEGDTTDWLFSLTPGCLPEANHPELGGYRFHSDGVWKKR